MLRPHLLTIPTVAAIYIKAIELVQPIIWGPCHVKSSHKLLIASGADRDVHAYIHMHTNHKAI